MKYPNSWWWIPFLLLGGGLAFVELSEQLNNKEDTIEPKFSIFLDAPSYIPLGNQRHHPKIASIELNFLGPAQNRNWIEIFLGWIRISDALHPDHNDKGIVNSVCLKNTDCFSHRDHDELILINGVIAPKQIAKGIVLPFNARSIHVEAKFYQRKAGEDFTCVENFQSNGEINKTNSLSLIDTEGKLIYSQCPAYHRIWHLPVDMEW